MNGKFIVYALIVSLVSTGSSWNRLLSSPSMRGSGSGSSYSGSSWSSNTGSGSSWGGGSGGSHK
ncbi:MAG: hypothetical protein HYS18_14800 [Burkholderiales bacterium]|nr:hypothetical protein [Burkholderiales bacterium]